MHTMMQNQVIFISLIHFSNTIPLALYHNLFYECSHIHYNTPNRNTLNSSYLLYYFIYLFSELYIYSQSSFSKLLLTSFSCLPRFFHSTYLLFYLSYVLMHEFNSKYFGSYSTPLTQKPLARSLYIVNK